MKRFFILIIAVIATVAGNAQIDLSEPDRINCGTAVLHNQRLQEDPSLQLLMDKENEWVKLYAKNHVSNKGVISYTIPVVFHVIHNNGPENVSKAEIEASMANLNEDFQKLNSDISQVVPAFAGIAADIEVQFRLAHIDPDGNCTEGITRTVSTETYAMTENAKSLVNWNTTKYLNIWVGQTMASGSGGWSYYPGSGIPQSRHGIVVRSAQLGNTITHEVGHYLNLPHLWGSSNTPNVASNCGMDDGVADTPLCLGATSCNTSLITCGSLDNVQNYMEYSGCSRMFTEDQKTRMHAALNSGAGSRNNLWSQANLVATGVADPYNTVVCAPVAEFSYNKKYICEGESVSFTDDSYNAIPTSWNWTFTGGTPNTSASPNPSITYNTAGTYDVTHQPSTTAGSGLESKVGIITVSSLTAKYNGQLVYGFENGWQYNNDWIVDNPSGLGWERNSTASSSGSNSIKINNFFTSNDGEIDEIISPSFNISSVATKTMTFKQAFAQKDISNNDRLFVYYSVNCGETWSFASVFSSGNLSTVNSTQLSSFVPGPGDWKKRTINLNNVSNATNVRFKFEFKSGGGNNIYIDDINIGNGSVDVRELSAVASFTVYPNPTNSSGQIAFSLLKGIKKLSINVRNAVGQEVTNVINEQSFSAGDYSLKIDEERKLASGIYFIEFNADNNVKVQKLIVQ